MKDIDWKRPTLIGSLIVAVPSLISFFTYPNRFFWFWSLIGGIVAAWLLSRASSRRLTLGDGAKIGFMSGLIGGAIYLVISAPVFAAWRIDQLIEELLKTPNPPAGWVETFMQVKQSFALRVMLSLIMSVIPSLVMMGFTVLGGLLGVAIFEKRRDQVIS